MSGLPPALRAQLLVDYLRPERPTAASCFRRAVEFASANGLPKPSDGAMRRMLRSLQAGIVTRFGRDAVASSDRGVSGEPQIEARGRAGTKRVRPAGRLP